MIANAPIYAKHYTSRNYLHFCAAILLFLSPFRKQILLVMKLIFKIFQIPVLTFSLVCLFLTSNQAAAQRQVRELGYFSKISFTTGGYLEIIQGDSQRVELEGPQSVIDQIITVIDRDRLRIYTKNFINQYGDLKIYITVKNLSDITIAGSGDVVVNSGLNTESINLEVTGSGNLRIPELKSNYTELQITGSGDIVVKGVSEEKIDINVTGSGGVKASELKTKHADINIAGSGSVEIYATEKLEGNIVGSGSIYYKGNPLIDTRSTGSGKTKPL